MRAVSFGGAPLHISALEHEVLGITSEGSDHTLSAAESEILAGIGAERPGFCERAYRSVRLAQYCGVVNLGGRVLEVLPKVGSSTDPRIARSVLLRLLRVSRGLDGFRVGAAHQHLESSPLLDIFIATFLDCVTVLLRGGLLRQYRTHEDDLPLVRGRILLSRQFGAHFNRPDVVACSYDELTADNDWNRFLKAGLLICRRWIVSGKLHRRWVELFAAFGDVADVIPVVGDFDRLVYDRHGARYRESMGWAKWLVAMLSPAMRAGSAQAPAFLFNMNAVFERVAVKVVERELADKHTGWGVLRGKSRFLARIETAEERKAFHLRPDIVVGDGRGIRIIADAKWKSVENTPAGFLRPTRDDMYQMYVYSSAFQVRELALVYPAGSMARDSMPTTFLMPASGSQGARLRVLLIDVERDDLPIVGQEAWLPRT